MGIHRQKPGAGPTGPDSRQRPVKRDYVEEVQLRAGRLHEALEKKGKKSGGDAIAKRRQEQLQRQMAQLRSEAVQARHLAEQINSLSQQTTVRKRQHVMTNTSTIDQGQTQRPKRRASDKPGGSQSHFNPLHPSMELPPEQLIRLLGLEDKINRKKRKSSAPTKPSPPGARPQTEKANVQQTTAIEPPARRAPSGPSQSIRRRSREQIDVPVFGEQRRGLLLPALGLGIVAGIALSAYLFWGQPQKPVTEPAQTRQPVSATKPTPLVGKPAPVARTEPPAALTGTKKKKTTPADNPKWRAAIQAQEQRLRAAARQRLDERIRQPGQSAAPRADTKALWTKPDTATEGLNLPIEPVSPAVSAPGRLRLPADETPPATSAQTMPVTGPAADLSDSGIVEAVTPMPPPAPDSMTPASAPAELPPPVQATESGSTIESAADYHPPQQ